MNRPKPLLMIPLRRCGSHALRLRLNFSPDFYSPYPLHLCDMMHLLPRYGDLDVDRNYFQLIIDVIGLHGVSMVKWEKITLDPVALFAAVEARPRSIHAIHWEMLLQAGEQYTAKVVMDKSLDSVAYVADIMAVQPALLLLNVVRDPRAQIGSMNRAIIYDFDTLMNTMRWLQAQQTTQQLMKQYPDRILTIRFEDFIADEEAVLRRICDFIAIDFLPAMLDIGNSPEACRIAKLSSLWQSNAYHPIAANIDKFKRNLTLEEIGLIESLTVEQMDHYGYERMTAANVTLTERKIKEASDHSTINKIEAWKKLETENYKDYLLRRFRTDYIQGLRNVHEIT